MTPNSQPFAAHASGPEADLIVGTCHVALITKTLRISKSDRPRPSFKSNQFKLDTEFPKASPTSVAELVSILFANVYDPCTRSPCFIASVTPTCKAWYSDPPAQVTPLMAPLSGLIKSPPPIGQT